MRLSRFEIESIKTLSIHHFGSGTKVSLFGSRIHNELKGGDIDLLIYVPKGGHSSIRSKINFMSDLILTIGEQKIDVVLDSFEETNNSTFLKTIRKTAIQL
jgi:predicted nucleotidyltransferase